MSTLFLKISFLIMGMSGIVGQIVLLREFLIAFSGNELTLGIILANWLILEAMGSFFLGKTAEKTERRIEIYVFFQLIFSFAFPLAIYLARVFKNLILTIPGEGLGFGPIFYSSFLVLLPMTVAHGALFTYGAKLYSQTSREDAPAIGNVYILETVGSIIGGLLVSFLLIQYFHSFEIALMIALLNTIISMLLLWPEQNRPPIKRRKILWGLSILSTLFFFYLLLSSSSNRIHFASLHSQWKNLNVIHNENSIYGNITITQRGEQFTFFTDGVPSITTPVPDIASIEDFVHFPMLFHQRPETVLILSGGAGGMIHEILKHPVFRVDYVELDPLLLKLIQKFPTPLTQSELSDQRVNIHDIDGRFFVNKTQNRFDLIFIGLSAPQELQTNRLFTSEFFSVAKKRMNPGGIIVLTLPGSLTYISPELKDLNGCLLNTLKHVYRSIRIIPGDVNLYLASDSDQLEKLTIEEVIQRLEGRKIRTSLFTKGYIKYRLHERWAEWFLQTMERRDVTINSDFQPLAVFFNLSYWNTLFSPYLTGMFKWFGGLNLKITLALTALFTMILLILFKKKPQLSRYALPYAIFTSGFADMMLDLAILFTFQTVYGYLYYQMGLLVTLFMAGIAIASLFITQRLDRIKRDTSLFLKIELLLIAFSILLPFILSIPSHHLEKPTVYVLLFATFLTMSFLCGVLVGLQFPLASKIYLASRTEEGRFSQTAGLLYGADLLGGFFGGLFGGVLLLPILGLKDACFTVAIIKMSSFLLLIVFMKVRKGE
jgi:spermidine synthase